jgi:hypothetical protein
MEVALGGRGKIVVIYAPRNRGCLEHWTLEM